MTNAGDPVVRIDAERATWRKLDDEIVVLDLNTSSYLSINTSGVVLWSLLEKGATFGQLVSALVETFDLDKAVASADVQTFIDDLAGRELLTTADG